MYQNFPERSNNVVFFQNQYINCCDDGQLVELNFQIQFSPPLASRQGGRVIKKIMEFCQFMGHFFTTPLYLHTERFSLGTIEGIRKLYFDGKN